MKIIKISKKKPPQWILDEVEKNFNVKWKSGIIFTYGNKISNYFGEMTEDLLYHERNHTKQQKAYGIDNWWREYLRNPRFRYNQELECYRKQFKWVKNNIKDDKEAQELLSHYASCLSGEMYGNIKPYNEAIIDIITNVKL